MKNKSNLKSLSHKKVSNIHKNLIIVNNKCMAINNKNHKKNLLVKDHLVYTNSLEFMDKEY